VILALFTTGVVSAAAVPETAYGHIATAEQVQTAPISEVKSVAAPSKPQTVSVKKATVKQYVDTSALMTTPEEVSTTESIVRNYFKDTPVLAEIARCESGFRHTLSDGSILHGRVDYADTGVMQINKRYHQATATAMGLNLDNIYDNMAYAKHLYKTQGLAPWASSAGCWK
jgi:hypothetical protein